MKKLLCALGAFCLTTTLVVAQEIMPSPNDSNPLSRSGAPQVKGDPLVEAREARGAKKDAKKAAKQPTRKSRVKRAPPPQVPEQDLP